METPWNLDRPRRGPSPMDWVKIAGFLVSFGTFFLLGLSAYSAFKDGQAAMLAELRGIRVEVGGINERVSRVEDVVFPRTPGRH